MTARFIDLGTGLSTRIRLAVATRDGRLAVELSGGQAAPLLIERGLLTVTPADLRPEEAELLAPRLASHPAAGIVRFRRDAFGGWELTPAVESPFRFYASLILAHLETADTAAGLRTVAVHGRAADERGVVASPTTLFHLIEAA